MAVSCFCLIFGKRWWLLVCSWIVCLLLFSLSFCLWKKVSQEFDLVKKLPSVSDESFGKKRSFARYLPLSYHKTRKLTTLHYIDVPGWPMWGLMLHHLPFVAFKDIWTTIDFKVFRANSLQTCQIWNGCKYCRFCMLYMTPTHHLPAGASHNQLLSEVWPTSWNIEISSKKWNHQFNIECALHRHGPGLNNGPFARFLSRTWSFWI